MLLGGRGCASQEVYLWGVCFPGGYASWGVCSPEVCFSGGGIQAGTEADPPVNRMTDRCKNITLPQTSLWTVIKQLDGD